MTSIDSLWMITTDSNIGGINLYLDSLKYQLNILQAKNDFLTQIVETSNSSVSNQLTAAEILLALIAILITVSGTLLGRYVRKKKEEVDILAKKVDEKKETIDNIAYTTKKLDEQIHSNIKDLYKQLRKEETNTLLERLEVEPRDVTNLSPLLLARDLDDSGFEKLRKAFIALQDSLTDEEKELIKRKSENNDCLDINPYSSGILDIDDFIILFFQHYCYYALKDNLIRIELVKYFDLSLNQAFCRDVKQSTKEICRALTDDNSSFDKEDVLVKYLKALNKSKHCSLPDLRIILEQNLSQGSLLKKAIERCTSDGVYLKLFKIEKPK